MTRSNVGNRLALQLGIIKKLPSQCDHRDKKFTGDVWVCKDCGKTLK